MCQDCSRCWGYNYERDGQNCKPCGSQSLVKEVDNIHVNTSTRIMALLCVFGQAA